MPGGYLKEELVEGFLLQGASVLRALGRAPLPADFYGSGPLGGKGPLTAKSLNHSLLGRRPAEPPAGSRLCPTCRISPDMGIPWGTPRDQKEGASGASVH